MKPIYRLNETEYCVHPVRRVNGVTLNIDGRQIHTHMDWQDECRCTLTVAGKSYPAYAVQDDQQLFIHVANRTWVVDIVEDTHDLAGAAGSVGSQEEAPMPGVVIDLLVSQGDQVADGDTLLLIESMKLQIEIKAKAAGVIKELPLTVGASFNKGDLLVAIDVVSEESQQ